MITRHATPLFAAICLVLGACGGAGGSTSAVSDSRSTAQLAQPSADESVRIAGSPAPTKAPLPREVADATDVEALAADFGPLKPGTYYIRPVVPDGPTIYVVYTIQADGWNAWIGSFKPGADGSDHTVALHILNVTNLVTHGCSDHAAASPPVGDTPEDLANALATLEPFEVVEPASQITRWGYDGISITLRVPELLPTGQFDFSGCIEQELKSFIGRPLSYAYYGYSPGLTEEFWILDVDGQRLMIAADHHAETSAGDIEELESVLDSIEIVVEPQPGR